ncbi:MAG: hypothetical protein KC454_06360 [Flavobacteriales bacterium]|nr:hypothetical protein [Flavobacteriales bacterium]
MKQYLIADSGGTKTDWCLIDSKGAKLFLTTESAHPSNWDDKFFERLLEFINEIPKVELTDLYFFGAGCLNEVNRTLMKEKLMLSKLNKVKVQSDLHAAGYALYGADSGWGAIMGTGSVLFKWTGSNVAEVVGGKGCLKGDEGSGFYFGNLIFENYCNDKLSAEQKNIFSNYLVQNEGVINFDILKSRACIAKGLHLYQETFCEYHEKNLEIFYQKHLHNISIKSLRILGGYAFHHSSNFIRFFHEKRIHLKRIIDKPIADLVEQMGVFID